MIPLTSVVIKDELIAGDRSDKPAGPLGVAINKGQKDIIGPYVIDAPFSLVVSLADSGVIE